MSSEFRACDGEKGGKKRKMEDNKEVSTVRRDCKITEKVASCVPHILRQVRAGMGQLPVVGGDAAHLAAVRENANIRTQAPVVPAKDWASLGPGSVFDSHCHLDILYHRFRLESNTGSARRLEDSLRLDGEGLDDRFGGCVANFCDPREWARGPQSNKVSDLILGADKEDRVYLSIGVHPHFADRLSPGGLGQLDRLVRGDNDILKFVVAIGECGLDYSVKNTVDRTLQKKVFFNQLILGMKYNLPLVLHIRDAEEDGYQVLEAAGVPADYQIHRHCFTGDWPAACTWLDKFPASKIGIAGCVTFRGAVHVHQTVRQIPLHRLLLETDAPYFLPVGVDRNLYKFSFSQPGHLVHVAAKVAELKKIPVQEVLAANRRNVTEIYGIKLCK